MLKPRSKFVVRPRFKNLSNLPGTFFLKSVDFGRLHQNIDTGHGGMSMSGEERMYSGPAALS
jgi:hypothetical protein